MQNFLSIIFLLSATAFGGESAFSEKCSSYLANSLDEKTCLFKLKTAEMDGLHSSLIIELKFACQEDSGYDPTATTSVEYSNSTDRIGRLGTVRCHPPEEE